MLVAPIVPSLISQRSLGRICFSFSCGVRCGVPNTEIVYRSEGMESSAAITNIAGPIDYLIVRYGIVAYGGLRTDSERQRQRLK